jgi:large subunit ribosomal protein L25
MDATLDARKRDGRGKNEARRLRVSGRIPAVVYGARKDGQPPEGVPVAVDPKEVLRHPPLRIGRQYADQPEARRRRRSRVMVRDYQLDPITHQLLHADFYQLAMDKEIVVSVPVVVKGEAAGVKQQGGLLDSSRAKSRCGACRPTFPEHIDIDVSELMLHQSIRVKDVPTNPKWKAVTDGETMLVHVVMPKAEESAATTAAEGEAAAPAAAAAAPSEPEVIKKGKTEKEEEAPKK